MTTGTVQAPEVVLERLLRALLAQAYAEHGKRAWCKVCLSFRDFGHRVDCPVAEAETWLAEMK